jgi:hypothetical protein
MNLPFWSVVEIIAYSICWILVILNLIQKDMLSAIIWILLIIHHDMKK